MRILLLEDTVEDADHVRHALQASGGENDVEWIVRLKDLLAHEDLDQFDVILSDLSLPDASGVSVISAIRAAAPRVAIVVLTSIESNGIERSVINEGAQDYVVKDSVDGIVLWRTIRQAVQRHRLNCENDELLRQLSDNKLLLEEKNRKLEQLCDTAQRFVENVSHEFRTPLTVIMEYASLLSDGVAGAVTEQQVDLLSVIDDRACDLNAIVDDMLDVSKVEAGLIGISRVPCHIQDVVDHFWPGLERRAQLRNVELSMDIPDDLAQVYCDPEKIGRVIVNLVNNAIKFARDPGTVSIVAEVVGEDALVHVSDNGPGISPEKLEEIFNRFSQLKTELKQSTKGFGLGLNIAQELVDLNFGRMFVRSVVGHGSRFSFSIPVCNQRNVLQRYAEWVDRGSSDHCSTVYGMQIRCADGHNALPREEAILDTVSFVRGFLRHKDLMWETSPNEWIVLVNTNEFEEFRDRFEREYEGASKNRPQGRLPPIQSSVVGRWGRNPTDGASELQDLPASNVFSRSDECRKRLGEELVPLLA